MTNSIVIRLVCRGCHDNASHVMSTDVDGQLYTCPSCGRTADFACHDLPTWIPAAADLDSGIATAPSPPAEETQRQNPTAEQIVAAQSAIATAIGAALGLWFVPVASGVACNIAEAKMVKAILQNVGLAPTDAEVDALFWFFRKKYMVLFAVTYVPWVGPAMQVLEVYALGQFVLACVQSNELNLASEHAMEEGWSVIEPVIWSGEGIVAFYENFAGKPFPSNLRMEFIKAVDVMGKFARTVERIPGLGPLQESLGEGMRKSINAVKGFFR